MIILVLTLFLSGCGIFLPQGKSSAPQTDANDSQEVAVADSQEVTADEPAEETPTESTRDGPTDGWPDGTRPEGDVMTQDFEPSSMKLQSDDCVDPDLDAVLEGTKLMLCDGSIAEGRLVLPTPVVLPDLTNLATGNVKSGVTIAGVTGSFSCPSPPDLLNLVPENVKFGVSINGVIGTLSVESHTDCSSSGQVGCVTTETLKAADLTNLLPQYIKSGVSIAGVSGQYPSVTYPLTGATAAPDLDLATFDARVKSSTEFEWFDAAGARHARSGDTDLTADNLRKDVTVFGATGTLEEITPPSPWDLRYGVAVGSVTGELKVNCRNSSPEDNPLTVLDPSEVCGAELWEDVTVNSDCASSPTKCVVRNRISNVMWSPEAGDNTWADAHTYCHLLGIDGRFEWRLPTHEELLTAFSQQIGSAVPSELWPRGTDLAVWSDTKWVGYDQHASLWPNMAHSGYVTDDVLQGTICVHD